MAIALLDPPQQLVSPSQHGRGGPRLLIDKPSRRNPADPAERPTQLATALRKAISQAKSEVILVSAYLVPTPALEQTIQDAEARGVQVRILTNSLRSNNHTTAHAAYRHHVRTLIDSGADMHEVRSDALTQMRTPSTHPSPFKSLF